MNDPSVPGLDGLDRETPPPPWLKDRVIRTLRERGLLGRRGRPWLTGLAALAASLVLFALGVAVGHRGGPEARRDPRPQYVLLLYGYGTPVTDADRASRVREYTDWARGLRREGRLTMGEELADSALLVTPGDASPAVGAVPAREQAPLVGLFIIRAEDQEEALRLARTNPHLSHGGSIVIRPVQPT